MLMHTARRPRYGLQPYARAVRLSLRNTLDDIYYTASSGNPRTISIVRALSSMMRKTKSRIYLG